MNPTIMLDHETTPDPERHVVRALLSIEGAVPADTNRVPLNLSVVLDRSGSMSGEKLAHAKAAAKQLLANVYPDDTTSVVTFESDVDIVAGAKPRRKHIGLGLRVGSIQPAGMTNLSGGWLEGRRQIEKFKFEQQSNRIILMTDGLANQGITDPNHLAQLFSEARAQGVTTSTIGFGEGFDEKLLERLADAGGGNTHYIEHPDQAPDVFKSELEELLALSAQNLVVELRLNDGVELAAVHHSYPRETIAGGIRLRLGDLYASEPKQLLVEMGARADRNARETPLATLEISGDVLGAEGGIEHRMISLPITFSPADGPLVHPEVQRTLVFLEAAKARRDALEDQRDGRFEQGAAKLRHAMDRMRARKGDPAAQEEAEDLAMMAEQFEANDVTWGDMKYMSQRSYDTSRSKLSRASILSRPLRRDREKRK